ncbi:hypothetical protein [Lacticaseibacillus sharpeae]|uniref:hypothetical protein n=1 Tax=Lacticaseibacillus sharpeae TaxID=1626 RepID=UPI001CDAD007|nr:hypothetical protein [Lacticaseibacillus sharpeae]
MDVQAQGVGGVVNALVQAVVGLISPSFGEGGEELLLVCKASFYRHIVTSYL